MVRDPVTPACPVCESSGQVYKLSQVYVAGITESADRSPADTQLLEAVLGQSGSPVELSELLRSFAPPAVPPASIPLIHPDLLALGVSILAATVIFFLYARASGWFWPAAGLGGGLTVIYLAARGAILTQYRTAREENKAGSQSSRRWLKVFYCARDGCVFDPEQGDHTALAEAQAFLLR